MSGYITFHFDDGFTSHYEKVFPLFERFGKKACISLLANNDIGMGFARALEMQKHGFEIMCHSVTHPKMYAELPEETAWRELVSSKKILAKAGFDIRTFVTPCSALADKYLPLAKENYDAAFTVYRDSLTEPAENLVMEKPADLYLLHRCCLSGKSRDELRAYVDYVEKTDSWLVFYEHDIGTGQNVTEEGLSELLSYISQTSVSVLTTSQMTDIVK